ncbi:MAG: PQQ-binding-like beta-propeller repeat protein [Caldilineaceae bacterium]
MSQAPHRVPPPPKPTPDNPFELQPVQPPAKERDLTAEILTISVIVAGLVLLGVGTILWVRDHSLVTPSPVATTTQVAEAVESPTVTHTATVASTATEAPATSPTVSTPAPPDDELTPVAQTAAPAVALPLVSGRVGTHAPTATASDVYLPGVGEDGTSSQITPTLLDSLATPPPLETPISGATATEQPITWIALPYMAAREPPPTPVPPAATSTPSPTATLVPIPGATNTPDIVGPPAGTPIATAGPSPTGLPLVLDEMSARMSRSADFHIGPSSIYTITDRLDTGVEITLHGRDRTGEWVFACCIDDDDADDEQDDNGWVRQASVVIEGNELDDDTTDEEDEIDRNDARWLPIVSARPSLRPLPTVTPPPEGDFPLFRYTPDNRAYIPNLPNLSTAARAWSSEPEAAGAILAPLVVAGSIVYGASSDNHIYAWDRATGSQRARRFLDATVTARPATDDGLVYFVDESGLAHALQDPIDQDAIWRSDLAAAPIAGITGINVFSHTLFINMAGKISVVDGENGEILHEIPLPATPVYPAIGGQLLYVLADSLRAFDAMRLVEQQSTEIIWERTGIPAGVVPPVYTARGVESLAELYVAGADNRIYSLDANTGVENWNDDNEESITGLAVSDAALYITGDGYVKARRRETPEDNVDPILWRTPIAGPVLAGPIVGPDALILFLQSGNILYMDAATGEPRANYATYPTMATAGGAASYPYVFAPGQDGKLYGYRQTP